MSCFSALRYATAAYQDWCEDPTPPTSASESDLWKVPSDIIDLFPIRIYYAGGPMYVKRNLDLLDLCSGVARIPKRVFA